MELRQLEIFCIIADELHFGRAAKRLYIAQSSVSQQLQRLEDEVGVRLVHRSSRQVSLTPAGSVFLTEVRKALGRLNDATKAVQAMGRGQYGTVRIGTNFPSSQLVLLPLLSALGKTEPGLTAAVRAIGSLEQERALELGDLDIGLMYGPLESTQLASRHVVNVDIVGLVRAEHPLRASGSIDLLRVSRYPFIAGHKGGSRAITRRVEGAVSSVGGTVGPERSEGLASLYLDLASSDVIGFTSRERAWQGVASGLILMELDPKPEPLEIHVAWNPTRNEPSVNTVLEMIFQLATA